MQEDRTAVYIVHQVTQAFCGGVTHGAMEKSLGRRWCLLPIPQGSDFLKESWSSALWKEPPHPPVGNCEGVGKAARLRGNVPANQLSTVTADGGRKAATLAQCYTVLPSQK